MTPRDRVELAYNHKEADRVPICIGGVAQKFSKTIYLKVKEQLGMKDVEHFEKEYDEVENIINYHPKVLDFFKSDFRHIQINRMPPNKLDDFSWQNELGFTLRRNKKNNIISITDPPLIDADLDDLSKYELPDPNEKSRFVGLRDKAKDLFQNIDYAIGCYKATWLGLFDSACALRSMDKFMMDLLVNKEFARKLLDKIHEYSFLVYENMLNEVGEYINDVEFNDDLGQQTNLMISPQTYREFIKPYQKEMVEMFKRKAKKAKVLFHSCGSVYDIIPDFIEIGIDILNPLQPLANKMEPSKLKEEFGNDLVFQGGIDMQKAMLGDENSVKKEVLNRIKAFAPGGGYILSTANNITDDVPLNNVFKLYEYAYKYGKYPISIN